MNDFEQFLKQRRMRAVPPGWRAEILAAARASADGSAEKTEQPRPWWLAWLWPSPVAWAGIACAWLLALGMNAAAFSGGDGSAKVSAPSSQAASSAMVQQQMLVREFFHPQEEPAAAPPPPRRDPSGASNDRRASALTTAV